MRPYGIRNRTSKACFKKNPILLWASGILVSQASLCTCQVKHGTHLFPFRAHKLSLTLLLPVFQVEIVRHKLGGVRRVLRQSSGSIPSWLAICLTNRPIIIRGSNTPHGHVYAVSQPSKWRETSARMYSIQQRIIHDRCLYAEWRISEAQLSIGVNSIRMHV